MSDDRDIVKKSEAADAVGMTTLEFWMGLLAT